MRLCVLLCASFDVVRLELCPGSLCGRVTVRLLALFSHESQRRNMHDDSSSISVLSPKTAKVKADSEAQR